MRRASARPPCADLLDLAARHVRSVVRTGAAAIGPDPCAMWMASLDARTGRYPDDDARPAHIPKRAYRSIDAPRGASVYWDQPALVDGPGLFRTHTGENRYDAVDGAGYLLCAPIERATGTPVDMMGSGW